LKEKEKKGKMELDLSGQLSRLQEEINDLFHSNWGPRDVLPRSLGGNRTEQSKATFTPKVDISETAKEVRISVDLPGVQKNDIKLETSGNRLTLSGSRVKLELEQDELYRTEERPYGQFNRSIRLPKSAKEQEINASFNDGVLLIKIPKEEGVSEPERGVSISIS